MLEKYIAHTVNSQLLIVKKYTSSFYIVSQVYSGVIRKANEEKFSYLVMQKRPKNSAASFVTTVNAKKGSKHREGKATLFLFSNVCM